MLTLRSSVTLLVILALTPIASAQTFTWSGGGSNTKWSNNNNWVGGTAPPQPGTGTADIVFTGTTQLSTSINASFNINTLSFTAAAGAFTLATDGDPNHLLTIQNGVTQQSANLQTITNVVVLGNSQTWSLSGGNLTTSDTVGGAGLLTLAGPGTLTMMAANTYT